MGSQESRGGEFPLLPKLLGKNPRTQGFLGYQHTWLAYGQLFIHHWPQVLISRAGLNLFVSQPVLIWGLQVSRSWGACAASTPKQQIPRQSLSREKPMRPLRLGEHLWCLKISQVYSNNESKINLAATRKPLQPHVSSQTWSQGVSAQARPARLAPEVPQTLSVTPCGGSNSAAAAPSFLPNKPCP